MSYRELFLLRFEKLSQKLGLIPSLLTLVVALMASTAEAATYYVTSLVDAAITTEVCNVDNSPATTNCTLRKAIAVAISGTDIIYFASTLSGQTITTGSSLSIDKSLTIDASSLSSSIIISGGGGANIFTLSAASAFTVTINNVTITGATSSKAAIIVQNNATLYLNNSTISNNTNKGISITQATSSAHLSNCTIVGNTANGIIASTASTTINFKNSIIAGNGPTATPSDCSGTTFASGGYNIVGSTGGCQSVAIGTDNATLTGATIVGTVLNSLTGGLYPPITTGTAPAVDQIPTSSGRTMWRFCSF